MSRGLGENQRGVLAALAESRNGLWWPGRGWVWDNYSGTVRILDSLCRRGLVERVADTRPGVPTYK